MITGREHWLGQGTLGVLHLRHGTCTSWRELTCCVVAAFTVGGRTEQWPTCTAGHWPVSWLRTRVIPRMSYSAPNFSPISLLWDWVLGTEVEEVSTKGYNLFVSPIVGHILSLGQKQCVHKGTWNLDFEALWDISRMCTVLDLWIIETAKLTALTVYRVFLRIFANGALSKIGTERKTGNNFLQLELQVVLHHLFVTQVPQR